MRRTLLVGALLVVLGCGDNKVPATDGATTNHPDSAQVGSCGDLTIDPGEDCDDGGTLDATCDATCHFTCGNGVLDDGVGEACDTGIAAGLPGACPTACDDGDACTTDTLTGAGTCAATCVHAPITATTAGDGCCPAGANATTDSDCAASCGNGVLEAGETCDTAIATGAGACPMTCDDMQSCTTDTLANGGTCTASCAHAAITAAHDGDGCCPAGATSVTDSDCLPSCGNGVVDVLAGETCDTAIAAGHPGACPTACSDGMVCTTDTLSNPNTCTAACVFPPITMPINNDGCCPVGANANNDNNCVPKCGNSVKEAGEDCDNGAMNGAPGNACSATCTTLVLPTAYRMSDLDLRDPHVFVNFIACTDVTDTPLAGFSVNGSLQTAIQTDGDNDGYLNLSPTMVFEPLVQSTGTTALDFYFAQCTAPLVSTTCAPDPASPEIVMTATSQTAGTCLSPIALTTHGYTPAITSAAASPTAACFASSPATVTLSLGGIPVTLQDARVAATYNGSPAASLVNGLLMGFLTQADADATSIPASFPLIGGKPLSSILPGGTGACPNFSDMDSDNGVPGWWFYLNFTAPRTTWNGP